MASIYFQNKIPMILAATPSNGGFLLAYDDDGILKQKDSLGDLKEINQISFRYNDDDVIVNSNVLNLSEGDNITISLTQSEDGYASYIISASGSIGGGSGTNGTSGTSGTSGTDGRNGPLSGGVSEDDGPEEDGQYNGQLFFGQDGSLWTWSDNNGWEKLPDLNGTNGTSGTSGVSGTNGTSGTSGVSGVNGTSGTSGVSGTNGTDGTNGPLSGSVDEDGPEEEEGQYEGQLFFGQDGSLWTWSVDDSQWNTVIDLNGTSGTSGVSGVNGTNGTSGTSGVSGVNGTSGTSGTDGTNGTSGTSGTDGTNGTSGTSGTDGTNGTSGTSGALPDTNELNQEIVYCLKAVYDSGISSWIFRWESCDDGGG